MAKEIEKKYLLREEQIWFGTALAIYGENMPIRMAILEELPIEGKFPKTKGDLIRQGYLLLQDGRTLAQKLGLRLDFKPVESRLRAKENHYFFTLKGDGTLSREEQEIEIPEEAFQESWHLTEGRRIEKARISQPYKGLTAEIDIYRDRNLITAEVECPSIEIAQRLPPLGKDITEDKRYKNKNLAK